MEEALHDVSPYRELRGWTCGFATCWGGAQAAPRKPANGHLVIGSRAAMIVWAARSRRSLN